MSNRTGEPTARPSDEDILNFENQIREEQVNVQPLVSTKLPINMLLEEYVDANFIRKINELCEIYSGMRKCRGDGNCFFRAFSFALIEAICSIKDSTQRSELIELLGKRITGLLNGAGFDKMAYDDFYEEFFHILSDPNMIRKHEITSNDKEEGEDYLCALWEREPHRSHSLVVLMRLVASAYLRANAQEYEPFIWESNASDMQTYCQKFVECLGVESDQIHAIAVGKALNVDIEIAYLDPAEGPLSKLLFEAAETTNHHQDTDNGHDGKIKTTLLYRPGHYDLLYPKTCQ